MLPIAFYHRNRQKLPLVSALGFALRKWFGAHGLGIMATSLLPTTLFFLVDQSAHDTAFSHSIETPPYAGNPLAMLSTDIFVKFVFLLLQLYVVAVALGVQLRIALLAVRGEKFSLSFLWRSLQPLPNLKLLAAFVLLWIITGIGFALLLIPGLIWALMLSMTLWIVVDYQVGPFAAMYASVKLTQGARWELLGFLILLFLLFLLVTTFVTHFFLIATVGFGVFTALQAISLHPVEHGTIDPIIILISQAITLSSFLFTPVLYLSNGFLYHWLLHQYARETSDAPTPNTPDSPLS